jgi:hypothetical protein
MSHPRGIYGLSQITASQQIEAKHIALRARERHGSTEKAACAIGIAKGTLSTLAAGNAAAGSLTYAKLKEYERRQLEGGR